MGRQPQAEELRPLVTGPMPTTAEGEGIENLQIVGFGEGGTEASSYYVASAGRLGPFHVGQFSLELTPPSRA